MVSEVDAEVVEAGRARQRGSSVVASYFASSMRTGTSVRPSKLALALPLARSAVLAAEETDASRAGAPGRRSAEGPASHWGVRGASPVISGSTCMPRWVGGAFSSLPSPSTLLEFFFGGYLMKVITAAHFVPEIPDERARG